MKIHNHWQRFFGHFYEFFKEKGGKYMPNFHGEFSLDGNKYRVTFSVQEVKE